MDRAQIEDLALYLVAASKTVELSKAPKRETDYDPS